MRGKGRIRQGGSYVRIEAESLLAFIVLLVGLGDWTNEVDWPRGFPALQHLYFTSNYKFSDSSEHPLNLERYRED